MSHQWPSARTLPRCQAARRLVRQQPGRHLHHQVTCYSAITGVNSMSSRQRSSMATTDVARGRAAVTSSSPALRSIHTQCGEAGESTGNRSPHLLGCRVFQSRPSLRPIWSSLFRFAPRLRGEPLLAGSTLVSLVRRRNDVPVHHFGQHGMGFVARVSRSTFPGKAPHLLKRVRPAPPQSARWFSSSRD